MLLRSRPDTVHRVPLRKTQTSTPLMKGSSTAKLPRLGITPAVADCRYRAPLSPRLRGSYTIPKLEMFVKCGFSFFIRHARLRICSIRSGGIPSLDRVSAPLRSALNVHWTFRARSGELSANFD